MIKPNEFQNLGVRTIGHKISLRELIKKLKMINKMQKNKVVKKQNNKKNNKKLLRRN